MKRLQLCRVRKLKLYSNLSLSCCPFQSYPALKCNIMQHVVKQSHSLPKCAFNDVLPTFFGGSVNGYNCDDPVNGALVETILVALSVESSSRVLEKRSFRKQEAPGNYQWQRNMRTPVFLQRIQRGVVCQRVHSPENERISPENRWLGDEMFFENGPFTGDLLIFWGVYQYIDNLIRCRGSRRPTKPFKWPKTLESYRPQGRERWM